MQVGDEVNASMCGTVKLGIGVITEITKDATPIYRVETKDGNYPLYQHEITPLKQAA